MITNFAVYLIFAGIIVISIAYKLTPFLGFNFKTKVTKETFNRFGNVSVLEKLQQSMHKFEVSDCLKADIKCKTDVECVQVCQPETINWYCDKTRKSCKPANNDIKPLQCLNGGVMVYEIDKEKGKVKNRCICTNSLYYGPSCDKGSLYCDIVNDSQCICKKENVHFIWLASETTSVDLCIPKIHFRLFFNQPNFKSDYENHEFDWFNFIPTDFIKP